MNGPSTKPACGARAKIGIALLLFGWAACSTLVEPQQWNRGRGPVVPHDTFPADCSLCHEGDGWHTIRADFRFDHEQETGIALVGAHAQAECLRCHNDRGPVAEYAARGCAGCHVDPHRGQLGLNCDACHQQDGWIPREVIAQHQRTRFPLVGAHAATACFACHPGAQVGNYSGLDPRCETCHSGELARATNPDHVAQGWTTDCQRCHVPFQWDLARYAHPGSFPLTGGHAGHSCDTCHTGGTFTGLSTDCLSCHQDDFQNARDPDHRAAGFPQDCRTCHGTTAWEPARFDHPGSFPLSGGHAGHSCSECHTGGTFTGLSTDCASCHLDDYQATTDPNHAASGFPQDCRACHGTTTWTGARFDHRFPIQGGPHGSLSCNQCHENPASYAQFTCVSCHEHSAAEMNDEHREVGGYVYASPSCLQCHPQGRD
jgi:hypothetical protein